MNSRIFKSGFLAWLILFVAGGNFAMSQPRATELNITPEETENTQATGVDSLLQSEIIEVRKDSLIKKKKVITPVESDDHKPDAPYLHYYDKHGNPLESPVLFLSELDTVKVVKSGPVYPKLNAVSFGVNIFDAILLAAGQSYGGFDVSADLSIYNWFFPTVEMGVGFGNNKNSANNFTYKSKPAFYAKVGLNYNFLYKSNPDYQAFLGLRAGFSHFSYDITDITINSSYWDQTNSFSLPGQKSTALYGEVLGGVKVKIVKNFSMGWTFRYHFKLYTKNGSNSVPWYIPGYGANSPINATFSLIYTIPLHSSNSSETGL